VNCQSALARRAPKQGVRAAVLIGGTPVDHHVATTETTELGLGTMYYPRATTAPSRFRLHPIRQGLGIPSSVMMTHIILRHQLRLLLQWGWWRVNSD
jgi:hypothetical protein